MPNRQAGFTLLEVLVASIIAALALGVLFRSAVDSQTSVAAAAQYQEALSRARSRLAALDAAGAPRAGDESGDDGGGYRWRVRTAPLAAGAARPNGVAPQLFTVSVVVSWGAGGQARSVQLDTRRLGLAPPPAPP